MVNILAVIFLIATVIIFNVEPLGDNIIGKLLSKSMLSMIIKNAPKWNQQHGIGNLLKQWGRIS